jgi:hypothetical protein
MVVAECGLHWMQRAIRRDTFDGHDLRAIRLRSQDVARFYCASVEVHGAGAALTGITADVRAGEPLMLAQELHEQRAGIELGANRLAIDGHRDGNAHGSSPMKDPAG